jgi:hypothetical protein
MWNRLPSDIVVIKIRASDILFFVGCVTCLGEIRFGFPIETWIPRCKNTFLSKCKSSDKRPILRPRQQEGDYG